MLVYLLKSFHVIIKLLKTLKIVYKAVTMYCEFFFVYIFLPVNTFISAV